MLDLLREQEKTSFPSRESSFSGWEQSAVSSTLIATIRVSDNFGNQTNVTSSCSIALQTNLRNGLFVFNDPVNLWDPWGLCDDGPNQDPLTGGDIWETFNFFQDFFGPLTGMLELPAWTSAPVSMAGAIMLAAVSTPPQFSPSPVPFTTLGPTNPPPPTPGPWPESNHPGPPTR